VFVGERRSNRAQQLGITWLDGRLAGKTLHDALRACGVDPAGATFLNLFHDGEASWLPCENALLAIRSLSTTGAVVVALGRRVQAALQAAGVPYLPLTHPAARGAVRARSVYQQQVADLLRSCRPGRGASAQRWVGQPQSAA
jgi:hypothetical protein